ncbi:hypothetical protein [Streptomyces sp. NBRC 110028]|nr:hypothetical protein [Streptomyces sp. NBRC 110028]
MSSEPDDELDIVAESGGEGSGHEQPLGAAGVVAEDHGTTVQRFADTLCQ